MQILSALTALFILAVPVLTVRVSYDNTYDNGANSLNIVACSDGSNGLESKGYTTFESLRNFPNIGGTFEVRGWNSPNCGTCWQLGYKGRTINMVAIDHTDDGFNLSEDAMNQLTNGQAAKLGVVDATFQQVSMSHCML